MAPATTSSRPDGGTVTDASAQPGVIVRAATATDMAGVQAIYAHYVENSTATFEETAPGIGEMQRRLADTRARGLPYLVAEDDSGAILGFAYASPFRTRSAYRFTVEDSVYVAPDAQRSGIGRALLMALAEQCAAIGYRQMVAVIGGNANAASIALHIRCGFRQVGLMPAVGFKFGRWIDSVRMQRALGDGDATPPGDLPAARTANPPPDGPNA
ncbi:MAG: GNAT family N-acetyltransferase [Alphaproteobacteria bacterium]